LNSNVVEKRIQKLVDAKWLNRSIVFARPIPQMTDAICTWAPRNATPDFGALAWIAKSRWKYPPQQIRVITASANATHFFSGKKPRGIRQVFQLSHDLGLSQVYVQMRISKPELAANWIGEGMISVVGKTRNVPDAIIGEPDVWPPQLVIEFAGSYGKDRIKRFHEHCHRESLPYELW